MTAWPKSYAWTPGKPGYKFYPQYANFTIWPDGRCVLKIRAPEFRTVGEEHYQMGETVCIQLPPDATAELRDFFASADTRPQGGDATEIAAPFTTARSATPRRPTPVAHQETKHGHR